MNRYYEFIRKKIGIIVIFSFLIGSFFGLYFNFPNKKMQRNYEKLNSTLTAKEEELKSLNLELNNTREKAESLEKLLQPIIFDVTKSFNWREDELKWELVLEFNFINIYARKVELRWLSFVIQKVHYEDGTSEELIYSFNRTQNLIIHPETVLEWETPAGKFNKKPLEIEFVIDFIVHPDVAFHVEGIFIESEEVPDLETHILT